MCFRAPKEKSGKGKKDEGREHGKERRKEKEEGRIEKKAL